MKLEFLDDLSDGERIEQLESDCLIRLYDFDTSEALKFQQLIRDRILTERKELVLGDQPFIEALNCELSLVIDEVNSGISRSGSNRFICKMNVKTYELVINQITPFTQNTSGAYTWLNDQVNPSFDDDIDFLFSWGGGW